MSDPQNPQLNKDFTLSQEQAQKQKTREEAMKEKLRTDQHKAEKARMEKVEALKDDKTRQDLKQQMEAKDKEIADQLDKIKEAQQQKINDKFAEKSNSLSTFDLTMQGIRGTSKQELYDKIAARYQAAHEAEQASFVRNSHDMARHSIDKDIQKAVEQEQHRETVRQQQLENRPMDQVFEKPVDRETRDDFNAASSKESKSWREVRAERMRDEMEKGR